MKGGFYSRLKKMSSNVSLQNSTAKAGNRVLITINVAGSAGPIRFLANEDDLVCEVIHTALKSYAREARLPLLGSDASNFLLYCAHAQADALRPREQIGSKQTRNFVLYKKLPLASPNLIAEKGSNGWKAWLNKSLSFKIQSH